MPKPPPPTDTILDQLRRVTDPTYHEPFFEVEGAICMHRGVARANAEAAKVASRSATRQFFVAPPGFESAGPAVRASSSISLRRTRDLDKPLRVVPGALSFAGPNGRVYRNTNELLWYPAPDPNAVLVAEVEHDAVGEPGNMDMYADADGKLTDPVTGAPQLEVLDIENLARGRAGIRASMSGGQPSTMTTSGAAPTWGPRDVGLFIRITDAGSPFNVDRLLRILSWSAATTPAEDGYYARTIEVDDLPQPALASSTLLDDGGSISDQTAAAQSGVADAVLLLPTVPAVNDILYVGADYPFSRAEFWITTRRYGDLTIAVEWWDGAVWQAASNLVDNTNAFAVEGVATIEHVPVFGWATTTISSRTAYFLRIRVTAFVSQAAQPLASRIVTYSPAPQLVIDPLDANGQGQISWKIEDFRDLGLEIVDMPAPAGGRDDDLGLKLAERRVQRRAGESLDMLRRRASRFPDVVAPELITWEINRILEPLGMAGEVLDVGDGFTGLFYDVPVQFAPDVVGAFDLYGPGDQFPSNPTMLPLSELEARWHFFVKVPPSGLGEFGAAWDEGPPSFYVEQFSGFLGCAWDFAFFDGYPWTAAQALMQVWARVNEAKGGGISFTMIQGDVATCP